MFENLFRSIKNNFLDVYNSNDLCIEKGVVVSHAKIVSSLVKAYDNGGERERDIVSNLSSMDVYSTRDYIVADCFDGRGSGFQFIVSGKGRDGSITN